MFYSKSAYQINSVQTINTGSKYHSDNYRQGFQWDQINEFVLKNLNTESENPLIPIYKKTVESFQQGVPSEFGSMKLDYNKFNLSAVASQRFGRSFEPEMLKFFNMCGSIIQTQSKWWNSGLLNGKLDQNIFQIKLPKSCP